MDIRTRVPLILTVLALVAGLSPLGSAVGQDEGGVQRLAGDGRTSTAAAIAERTPNESGEVIIAAAGDFADALAGAYLGRPILLTGRDSLPPATAGALDALAPSGAIIVGGPAAVSEAVEADLAGRGLNPRRLEGESRYGTAAAVAGDADPQEIGVLDGLRTVLLASGESFADAMVAGPVSASARMPILLTRPAGLSQETADALSALEAEQVLIVGGPAAVSAEVLNTIQESGLQVRRLAGDSRQETAVAVAEFARAELGWQPAEVILATGADFPDALAAGPYGGARQAPVLLTGGTHAADAVGSLLGCAVTTVTIVGGEAVVTDEEAQPVLDAAGTGDACAFAPQTTPTQAVVPIGGRHEVVMDTRALMGQDQEMTAQPETEQTETEQAETEQAETEQTGFAQSGSTGDGGDGPGEIEVSSDGPISTTQTAAEVRFTATPDTNSIAMATVQPADSTATATAVSGGLEATVPVDADGKATFPITSRTPGLVVVQACVSGGDDEEICQEVAVQFSARYSAPVGDGGIAFAQVIDGQVCVAVNLDGATAVTVTGPDGLSTAFDQPLGCADDQGFNPLAMDAAPADYAFVVDGADPVPLTVIGSDYGDWESSQVAPFIPGPATQGNTELITSIGELNDVTAINFIDYGDKDVLFATGRFGLKSYDVSDPANPVFLDWEEMPDFWENEDMTVDPDRKIVVLSRDPRAYGGSTNDGRAGIYLIDATDPADLTRIVFHELPTGHTASCVLSEREDGTVAPCDFLWSGGPATGTHQPDEWTGRPIFVTDIRDPQKPFTHPTALLEGQADGETGYAHDVQVDADGLAWVSSRGGVYGFHTHGTHTDPLTGEERQATPPQPVPFAGGTLEGEDNSGGVIHNAYRPVGEEAELGADLAASGFPEGDLIYATDEAFTSGCTSDGLFNIVSLEGSYAGEGFTSTPDAPVRLRTVGTWSPITAGEPGPVALCSAHYFDMKDRIVAYSWYGQGTRFIDVSDPTNPIQVAFHRPLVNTSFAPRFRGDVVFVADSLRGIDIIRLTDGAATASATRTQIAAPTLPGVTAAQRDAALTGGPVTHAGRTFVADPVYGWSCWVRRD